MRKKRFMKCLLALIAIIVLALYLEFNVFTVKTVEVSGADERDAIVKLAKIDFGERTRKADIGAIRANITASGIYECLSVEKDYPGTIIINVKRRERLMIAQCGGSYVVMDYSGAVISESRNVPDMTGLIYVSGLEARSFKLGQPLECDAKRLDAARAAAQAIRDNAAGELISEVNVANPISIFTYTRTGLRVELGDSDNLNNKIILMKYAVIDMEGRGEVRGTLDVSNGVKADYAPN